MLFIIQFVLELSAVDTCVIYLLLFEFSKSQLGDVQHNNLYTSQLS